MHICHDVLIACDCHNKYPQTQWLKTTETCSVSVSLSQNRGANRAMHPVEALGKNLPALVAAHIPWLQSPSLQSVVTVPLYFLDIPWIVRYFVNCYLLQKEHILLKE